MDLYSNISALCPSLALYAYLPYSLCAAIWVWRLSPNSLYHTWYNAPGMLSDAWTNERRKTENQKIRPLTFHYDSWKFLFTMENMNEESIKNLWGQYKLLHLDGICRVNLFNRKWPNLHFSQMNHNILVSPPPIPYILSKDILLLGSQGNQRISFLLNSTNGKIMQSKTISNIFSPLQDAI